MKNFSFVLIVFLLGINSVFTNQFDTLVYNALPQFISDEMQYYNLNLKVGKKSSSGYFVGFDFISFKNAYLFQNLDIDRIDFFSNDTLVFSSNNASDTGFIWLIKKAKYIWYDTLRFSESRKTKKIEHSEVFRGYKYLNPNKIRIKSNDSTLTINSFNTSLLIFRNKVFLSFIPFVNKAIIVRKKFVK